MGSDRQVIADQILKAIDYGNLPQDEIERRLEQIIETELNVPFNAEINKEKVDLCNSLLKKLYFQGKIEDETDIEESKEKVRKRVNAYRRRRSILWTAVRSIAAALILVVGLTLLNVIPPIRWFTGTSTDDEQQYIVQGHVINTQTIANAISEHNGSGLFNTRSNQELNDYLGFEVIFPPGLGDEFLATEYSISISTEAIRISCNYSRTLTPSRVSEIKLSVTLFSSTEDFYTSFEQDNNGEELIVNKTTVYVYENLGRINYVWTKNNALYRLTHISSIQMPENVINSIVSWRF